VSALPEPPPEPRPNRYMTREELLASAKPLPPYPEMVIPDLTDEEEEAFLAFIREL
jgi:hypothetical protein